MSSVFNNLAEPAPLVETPMVDRVTAETDSLPVVEPARASESTYVKPAQIISTREDLFPKQYTDVLSDFTDNLDPMPLRLAKAVVQQELLNETQSFNDVFLEFDEVPLGAAR